MRPPSFFSVANAQLHLSLARGKFLSQLINRSIHSYEKLDVESILVENLGFVDYRLSSNYSKLLDLANEYYPQLVCIFCANVRTGKMEAAISLECQVKCTKFTLTMSILNWLLELPNVTPSTPPWMKAKNRCLVEFAHPQCHAHTSHLSYLIL